ncbi:hypothetical protein DEALK_09820 [Dehalogenimonas alkenigignens]|uniref:Uncharacterized protein n=1 Tax=Dehalogenimonas alkenigignens TaxID=1217799 RepID=A0A0W0GHW3_9CHLR|nr:hypothetical protein DEALK_09820 [Dehalogenimonas alkenigignens]
MCYNPHMPLRTLALPETLLPFVVSLSNHERGRRVDGRLIPFAVSLPNHERKCRTGVKAYAGEIVLKIHEYRIPRLAQRGKIGSFPEKHVIYRGNKNK